jgi:hypothetical protein
MEVPSLELPIPIASTISLPREIELHVAREVHKDTVMLDGTVDFHDLVSLSMTSKSWRIASLPCELKVLICYLVWLMNNNDLNVMNLKTYMLTVTLEDAEALHLRTGSFAFFLDMPNSLDLSILLCVGFIPTTFLRGRGVPWR